MSGADGPVLVTGATGFLGEYVVLGLLARGVPVRALGRNPSAGLSLIEAGADFRPVDLRDADAVIAACKGVSRVIHAGALSSAWGRYRDFFDINVTGTQNVVDGCLRHGVRRLVYVSSPSVMSVHAPQVGLDESHPLPDAFVSDYSATKALAEARVRDAGSRGLEFVILRPKALYGPGDTSVFPRIIEAVTKGRLPIFGDGEAMTNVTHVTDATQAVLLAMESAEAAGNTYLITGGEDVRLYEIIGEIAARLGYDPPSRPMPVKRAMAIARALESAWRHLPLPGEPPLTTYKVSIMAYTQTYDISAAKRDLGYEPRIRWRDGMERFLESLTTPARPAATPAAAPIDSPTRPVRVGLTAFNAGHTSAPARVFGFGGGFGKVEIPALFFLVEHPRFGRLLVDTGYSTRFHEATRAMPERLYALATPVDISEEENAGRQLQARGIAPETVDRILLTHFDPDHIGGLRDFPNAEIRCSRRAWESVAGKTGLAALRDHLLTGLLPDDLAARVRLLPDPNGPAFGPFAHTHDFFGDESILLVELPGHKPGMLGVLLTDENGRDVLVCADALWTTRTLEDGASAGLHGVIAKDRAEQRATYEALRRLHRDRPSLHILPSHCPLAAKRFLNSNDVSRGLENAK